MDKILIFILFSVSLWQVQSQELMTVGKEKVSVDEFLRIYRKNNLNTLSYSEKEINEYLDLFTLFKMKLQEARHLKLDTLPAIKEDYDKYTDQLVQNHFVDKNYIENIYKSQFENMKYDVKVAHIMVKVAQNASPADTLLAYNKLNYIRSQANKDNFAKLAAENSEDKSTAERGGLLGYITAFMTFPDFENQCYNTLVGGISPVFRTQYGYHILHILEKRPARGRIKVAHIFMKKSEKNEEEKKMQEAYKLISTGKMSFEDAVKKYSEDASTKETKGELNEFGVSEMVSDFEEQCFALNRVGDISKPFSTEYGWHLVKLIEKKPIVNYEQSKDYIRQRMSRDPRVNNLKTVAYQRMLTQYQFSENPSVLADYHKSLPDTFFMQKGWKLSYNKSNENNVLFQYAAKPYTIKDFVIYANENFKNASTKSKLDAFSAMYNAYKEANIWTATKQKLKTDDVHYSNLESEYMNGLLIFDIMDREVWKKAILDTNGSKKLYEEVKGDYWYRDRAVLEGIKTRKPELAATYTTALANLSGKKLLEQIKKSKDSNEFVYYERTVEKGDYPVVDSAMESLNKPFVWMDDDKATILSKVISILPPSIKSYDDVRGRIQNLYQTKIEKNWGAALRAKYPVKVNQAELNKIIKK